MDTNPTEVAVEVLIGLLVLLVVLYVHFLPALFAYRSRHPSRTAFLLLNVFFGWTLVGWVIALVWALAGYDGQRDAKTW